MSGPGIALLLSQNRHRSRTVKFRDRRRVGKSELRKGSSGHNTK